MSIESSSGAPEDSGRPERLLAGILELLEAPALPGLHHAIAASARQCARSSAAALFVQDGTSYHCLAVADDEGIRALEGTLPLLEQWLPLRRLQSDLSSILVADTRTEPGWSELPPSNPGVEHARTWLGLALPAEERLLGFIGLSYDEPTALSDDERALLETFARAASTLLRQATLLTESAAVVRRSAGRLEIGARLEELTDPNEAAVAAVEAVRGSLGASFVGLYNRGAGGLQERAAATEPDYGGIEPRVEPALQSLLAVVFDQQRTLAAPAVAADPCPDEAIRAYRETLLTYGIQALMIVPVIHRGTVSAALLLIHESAAWSAGDVLAAEQLATDLGRVLARTDEIVTLSTRTARLNTLERGLRAALDAAHEILADVQDLRAAARAIGEAVPTVLATDALLIAVMPNGNPPLESLFSDGVDVLAGVADSIAALLAQTDAPWLLNGHDPGEGPEVRAALRAAGFEACLAVPVAGKVDPVAGVVLIGRRRGAFNETEMALAGRFASMLGAALQREQVLTDTRNSAVRDERDRLAREIHGVLAQTITGLVMQLDSLATAVPADSPLHDRLEQARGMGRSAAAETRRLVWNLRPASVDLRRPRVVVTEEAGRFERRANLHPQVDVVGEDRMIASEIGAVVQRLMHVTLENVMRHSGASQVRILLNYGLHGLSVQVEDDGKGFDPEMLNLSVGRLGLASVAERARQVGGNLRIESAAGQGTRVQVELPFDPAPPLPKERAVPVQPVIEPRVEPAADGPIRIVLIDDHAMVRDGLSRMLREQPDFRVLEAVSTGAEGLRAIAELKPDVVLCDLQLPDIPGTEVIARARAHFPDIRCLVVTTFDDDDYIYEAIKAGAKGYVLKDASAVELMEAVHAVARNESLLQPIVAHKLVERFGALARQGDMVEALTEREIEVLRALAGGLRNKEIAFQLKLSESTIKTHLASIFGKLGVTTRTEAVGRGRELGLIPL
jgi:DNA-binding NarL/FixJ family response regulator/signal transduction histidine kinase